MIKFFAGLISLLLGVITWFKIKLDRTEKKQLKEHLRIERYNRDVTLKATKAAQPLDHAQVEEIKNDVQDARESGNYADPFNPVLPDDK